MDVGLHYWSAEGTKLRGSNYYVTDPFQMYLQETSPFQKVFMKRCSKLSTSHISTKVHTYMYMYLCNLCINVLEHTANVQLWASVWSKTRKKKLTIFGLLCIYCLWHVQKFCQITVIRENISWPLLVYMHGRWQTGVQDIQISFFVRCICVYKDTWNQRCRERIRDRQWQRKASSAVAILKECGESLDTFKKWCTNFLPVAQCNCNK